MFVLKSVLEDVFVYCVQSVTYRYREFVIFSAAIRTGIRKIWYRKKFSEPVLEKFGTGKSIGTGIGKIR